MKKAFSFAAVLCFVFILVCPLYSKTITLIHSNDTHGTYKPKKINIGGKLRLVGGMEATSHYINKVRATEKNVLIVETGDIMTGTLASEIEYEGVIGGVMIEFLNRLGYDIFCFGNHDFDKGKKNALGIARLATFPAVMSNIVYKKSGRLFLSQPYHVFDIGGLKVGIIAVMEENFLEEVSKESVEGLDVLPIIPTLNSYVPDLDEETDLIVVVLHGGMDEGVRVAKNVGNIDVVLVASEDGKFIEVDGVLVKSTLGHQRTLGYLKVEVEEDRVTAHEDKLVWLWADVDLSPSSKVTALVKEVDASIEKEYAKVIGKAEFDHSIEGNPVESVLGNWITDVMRWKTGAQIGLHNSGGIRAGIKAGSVTKSDVFDVCPFHNTLVVFKFSGQQLKDALEYDVERGRDRLQVSGIKYKYFVKEVKPFGDRVDYVEINGEVLVKEGKVLLPKEVYVAVSNDYLVEHGKDKYFGLSVIDPRDTELPLDQILMEWMEKHEVLDYKLEKRIVEIKR
ncbi:MAG: bifunctional UDP-sugar hydrolase/5'-nucleotidase [Candidatus Aminicenantaceae bacterium]